MWFKIIQYRLVLLISVLMTASLPALFALTQHPVVCAISTAGTSLLTFALLTASLAALAARYPATFQVRDGTFTTPPTANLVLLSAALTTMPPFQAGLILGLAHPSHAMLLIQIATTILMFLLLPLLWCRVLGPFGLFLRPDGIFDRQLFGSLFVPWDAWPAAQPVSTGVKLRIARPDLVVRRGWRPGTTILTAADPGFTAWAINLYTTRPDYRPTIGTPTGLHQLRTR